MKRVICLLVLPCLLLALCGPVAAASTSVPVLTPQLNWTPVSSSDDLVVLETIIYGGTLYVGEFSGNVKEFPGGSAYGVSVGSSFPKLTLDLGGLTSYPGLFSAGNVSVMVSCSPVITFRDGSASYPLTDPSATVELMYGYQPTSGFSVSNAYTAVSVSGGVDSVAASWDSHSSNWTASYLTWTFNYSLPSDLPIDADSMDIECPIKVRIFGSPDIMETYVTGSVVGDAIWDGLIIDNAVSNNNPVVDLNPDISGDGTVFITEVIEVVRSLPWVQSTLVISLTWVLIAFVLWRRD